MLNIALVGNWYLAMRQDLHRHLGHVRENLRGQQQHSERTAANAAQEIARTFEWVEKL